MAIGGEQTRVLVEQIAAVDPSHLGESQGLLSFDELRDLDGSLAPVVGLVS